MMPSSVVKRLLARLQPDDLPVYIVGGAVRDGLLGRPLGDVDLVCRDPAGLARHLARSEDTAAVPFLKRPAMPCYRVLDRRHPHHYVDITGIQGGSLHADLRRRDFTINAMALPLDRDGNTGDLIDPLDGRTDLATGLVRATGPGVFKADPIRILRGVRLAAVLGFTVDGTTRAHMQAASSLTAAAAGERLRVELERILSCSDAGDHVRLLDDVGVLSALFADIATMQGCLQNAYHHLDVWTHSLAVLDGCDTLLSDLTALCGKHKARVDRWLAAGGRHWLLKFAALFHDIGKPAARRRDVPGGPFHFRGHDRLGSEKIKAVCERLKLAGRERAFVQALVAEHMNVLFLSRTEVRPRTLMRWFRRHGEDMLAMILLSLADMEATRGPLAKASARRQHRQWAARTISAYYDHLQPRISAQPLINGNDLLDMGLLPGPAVGRILAAVREAQDEGWVTDRDQALALARRLNEEKNGGTTL